MNAGRGGISPTWVVLLLVAGLVVTLSGCQGQTGGAKEPMAQPQSEGTVEVSEIGSDDQMTPAQDDAALAAEGPRITLEETAHDFGEIGPGTSHEAEFKFTNTGNAPLIVTQVRSCCGVVTKGVKNGQRYAPGRSGVLEIEYQAAVLPGDMKRNLYIYCNDPTQSLVPLTVQAKIMRRIEVEPRSLKLFLKRENAGAGDIKLKSLDGRPFAIKDFRATANTITAEFDPEIEATEFVLDPKADMEKLERNLRGQIRITLTHPETKEVALLYDVLPEFTVTPPQIMLFDLQPGKTVRREIWILGNYKEDFEIESVSSQKGYLELAESEKVKGSARTVTPGVLDDRVVTRYQLAVDITPPAEKTGTVLSDELHIKIADGETVRITCRGFYRGN
jgi:hypothetical protein